jgi:ribonuclease R
MHRHKHRRKKETTIEGVIQHHGRFAFLISEEENGEDVFLRGPGLRLAMDGDRVEASVYSRSDGRMAGEILRVVKRSNTSLVGVLRKIPSGWAVFNEKGDAPPTEVTGFFHDIVPKEGALAVLKIDRWPTEHAAAAGIVTELLGAPDDVAARITSLLRARGIDEKFPKEALAQSAALPDKLDPSMWHGREELFNLTIVTIDGADAKDFDDAVSIEHPDKGMFRLGVHIADVAHYVKPGSALDTEAYERGTSVYLPDRVVPMLPPSLSNNLCSLVPYQERLTVSVFMDIDTEGKVVKRRLANTVIRSCRRFTYEEVQSLLNEENVADVSEQVGDSIRRMGDLADILSARRMKRGALDFDLPEYKVQTDLEGRPLRVVLRPRLESHRLIEEFMLLANEAIATELMAAKMPFLHRRHDEPDPAKLKTLAKTLGDLGLTAGHLGGGNTHKALQEILVQAREHPLADIINNLIVRSMKLAVYSPESLGHFGIAAKAYAHFTSPIRRYPDLTAHRAIKALIDGRRENHGALPLEEVGDHCSERERAASEAEHKSVDIMRAELFKRNIGAEIEGVVTTVIETGCFILFGDSGAEGLLRVTDLKPGTKVKVIVDTVDTAEGKIGLSLAEKPKMPAQWRVTPRKDTNRQHNRPHGNHGRGKHNRKRRR